MSATLLALNAGSSSVKFNLFGWEDALPLLATGKVAGIGEAPTFYAMEIGAAASQKKELAASSTQEDGLQTILDWVQGHAGHDISIASHRVVHGGTFYRGPVIVAGDVVDKLRSLCPLAPLHQPHNLAAIEILARLMPDLVQTASFDTAFHAGHAPLFNVYAVPHELAEKGIRRYGFHGLSYKWIAEVLRRDHAALATGRVIAAHLGNGASLCAMKDGYSIDTTMGMTALDGLPMGTRCGSFDPGAVIYMIRTLGMSSEEAEHVLYTESGLKGLSRLSNDVKTLQESASAEARFALDYFALKTAQMIGMLAVALEGVDGIVFTGGIGENATAVREAILKRLAFLGRFETLVIPANEERMMAMEARAVANDRSAA